MLPDPPRCGPRSPHPRPTHPVRRRSETTPTTTFSEAADVARDRGRCRDRSIQRHSRPTANRAGKVERSWLRRALHTSLTALDAPHTIELRPAVAHILQVGAERGRLVVHAKGHIRRILPKKLLHFAADLLLRREIRRVEPRFAQRFHFRIGGPAEPRIEIGRAACRDRV